MRRPIYSAMILIAAIAGLVLVSGAGPRSQTVQKPAGAKKAKVNLDLDEKTATQIAEIVLVKIYGDHVKEERPWKVSKEGAVFKIVGTFKGIGVGGVALIRINRTNAEVVEVTHGK